MGCRVMHKLAIVLVSLFALTAAPARAAGRPQDNWVVTQLSGDARVVHRGAQPASLKINNQLVPGDMLLTGPTGRATLVHGGDYIIVAPGSELRLPAAQQPSGFTRVMQNLGTLLFKVQHTGIPHFAVDTPMLAAVVKGTTFTVVVDQHRSAVQVIQGVVQVSAIDGGMSRMVEGGRTIFINHDHPEMLLDADKSPPPARAPSSTSVAVSAAGDSPLSTISALTGGLVRPDLTPPQPAALATPIVQTVVASGSSVPTNPATGTNTVPSTSPGTAAGQPASSPSVTVATTTSTGGAPTVTVPPVSTPTVTTPGVTTPSAVASATTPPTTSPSVTTPAVTVPSVTVASVTTPVVTTPTVTTPAVSTPSVTVPGVTVASVTTPVVTTPSVTVPSVTVPSVTVPSVTVASVTTPVVTTPSVTVPSVTVPSVTVPSVTV